MHRVVRTGFLVALTVGLGCQTYRARPLEPEIIFEEIARRRAEPSPGEVVTLARAVELMRSNNTTLREARAAHATARAVADVPTPLPNPTLEAGSLFFGDADLLSSAERSAEAALGWSVFLSGRRRITDERNDARAEAARIDAAGTEREEYLELRGEFAAFACSMRTVEARREMARTIDAALRLTRRMIDAAQATALDLRELELESFAAAAALMEADEALEDARADVALRCGVVPGAIGDANCPPLPDALPTLEKLRPLLLRDHPGLARLRANYEVAERELRLEIARQYPALDLGLGWEREEGVDKFGLSVGIELPIFDRNRQGIAEAKAHRDEMRTAFEAEAERALAAIESAHRRVTGRRERHALLRDKAVPAANDALRLARRSLESGVVDAMRYLLALRSERSAQLDLIESERAVYEAWSELERACGAPLLRFPGEPGEEDR